MAARILSAFVFHICRRTFKSYITVEKVAVRFPLREVTSRVSATKSVARSSLSRPGINRSCALRFQITSLHVTCLTPKQLNTGGDICHGGGSAWINIPIGAFQIAGLAPHRRLASTSRSCAHAEETRHISFSFSLPRAISRLCILRPFARENMVTQD